MGWRELAEQRSETLRETREELSLLQDQLAGSQGSTTAGSKARKQKELVEQLQQQLRSRTKELEDTQLALADAKAKIEELEHEASLHANTAREAPGQKRAGSKRGLDDSDPCAREPELKKLVEELNMQVLKLTNDLLARSNEMKSLQATNKQLLRQLQAEKSSNTSRYGLSDAAGKRDEDDEEPLPIRRPGGRAPYKTENGVQTTGKMPASQSARSPKPAPLCAVTQPTSTDGNRASVAEKPTAKGKPKAHVSHKRESPAKSKQTAHPERKRKRNEPEDSEDIEEELADLHLHTFEPVTGPRRKKRTSTTVADPGDDEFDFRAICCYDKDGAPLVFSREELTQCEFLFERIKMTKEIWERNKGMYWLFDFTKTRYKPSNPPCVSSKIAGRKTRWRAGAQGRYACLDCAQHGRPCFTWVDIEDGSDWSTWEFQLLPLHEDDRTRPVVQGETEVRYWLNDSCKFSAADLLKEGDEDSDYVDG